MIKIYVATHEETNETHMWIVNHTEKTFVHYYSKADQQSIYNIFKNCMNFCGYKINAATMHCPYDAIDIITKGYKDLTNS